MTKRGRPKLNRPRHDYGTPELVHKRMMISPVDATLSTTPLDALKSRGVISDEAHAAASYFRALRQNIFGKAHVQAVNLGAISGAPDESVSPSDEIEYRDACSAMKCHGRQVFDAVENCVVHERWPDFLKDRGGPMVSKQKHLMLGLAALLGWFRNRNRKAA